MRTTRNVDPEIGRARALLGVAVRLGNDQEAEHKRQELRDLVMLNTAEKVAAALDDLTPEKAERIRALFGGA